MDGAGPKATSIALRGVAEEVTPPPGEYGNQPSSPPKQNVLVLGISKFSKGVSSHPAISGKDVEISIVPKEQLAPIVVRGWFFNLQNDPKRRYPPPKKNLSQNHKARSQQSRLLSLDCHFTVGKTLHSLYSRWFFEARQAGQVSFTPLCQWEPRCSERVSNMLTVTKPMGGRAWTRTQVL